MIRGETQPCAVSYRGGMGEAEGLGTDCLPWVTGNKSCGLKVQLEYKGISLRALSNGWGTAGTLCRVGGLDKCRQVQSLASLGSWML